jgi:hypothetical protein
MQEHCLTLGNNHTPANRLMSASHLGLARHMTAMARPAKNTASYPPSDSSSKGQHAATVHRAPDGQAYIVHACYGFLRLPSRAWGPGGPRAPGSGSHCAPGTKHLQRKYIQHACIDCAKPGSGWAKQQSDAPRSPVPVDWVCHTVLICHIARFCARVVGNLGIVITAEHSPVPHDGANAPVERLSSHVGAAPLIGWPHVCRR